MTETRIKPLEPTGLRTLFDLKPSADPRAYAYWQFRYVSSRFVVSGLP